MPSQNPSRIPTGLSPGHCPNLTAQSVPVGKSGVVETWQRPWCSTEQLSALSGALHLAGCKLSGIRRGTQDYSLMTLDIIP